jgi:hypothetical protein
MTRDDGDHGDSSFPRLLNYPISKYLESPLCSFVSFVVKAFDLPIAAMTCDDGDHGDSSFPRLLNYRGVPPVTDRSHPNLAYTSPHSMLVWHSPGAPDRPGFGLLGWRSPRLWVIFALADC